MARTITEDAIWQAEGAEKRSVVRRMFGEIAPTYDLLNGIMSLSLHKRWRESAVCQLSLREGDTALDVCCGTGDFILPLRRAVGEAGKVFGIDFSLPMLEIAQKKTGAALAIGDAGNLPLRAGSADGVSVGWGIRNVPDIDLAHAEIHRILRTGGRFVSLDMAQPRNPLTGAVSRFLFNTLVPSLGRVFGKTKAYTYLPRSTERFWSREDLRLSMERAGFVDVGYRDFMFGNICLHWGRKP